MTMAKDKKKNTEDTKLKVEILEANLKNTDKEIQQISQARDEVSGKLELLREQMDLREKMHRCALKNFKPLNPNWEFQRDPEYVALQAKMSENEFTFKVYELQSIERQILNNIKSYDEQISSQQDAKALIEKQISELKGD